MGAQAVFSDPEQILYGVVLLVVETIVLDKVMLLGQSQIQLFVISRRYEEIRQKAGTSSSLKMDRYAFVVSVVNINLVEYPGDIKTEAKAWAAAGSDARMSGCELPVIIVSGSGNQGITASVPVAVYAPVRPLADSPAGVTAPHFSRGSPFFSMSTMLVW